MGIKNLTELIKKYSPESIRESSWQTILEEGVVKRIAFDIPNLVYAYSSSALKTIVELSTDEQLLEYADEPGWSSLQAEVTRRITNGILNLFVTIQTSGGKAVAVFDGKHIPSEKTLVTSVRTTNRDKMREDLMEATANCKRDPLMVTPEDFKQLRRAISTAMFFRKNDIYKHIAKVLRYANVPCVLAHGEGEKCASYLNLTGRVDAVYSTDMDTLAFGAKVLISPSQNNAIRVINVSRFLQETNMSVEDVISIALVSGCDYTSGIKGIGPFKAYKGVVLEHNLQIPEENEKFRVLFQHNPGVENHLLLPDTSTLENIPEGMSPPKALMSLIRTQ